MIYNPSYLRSIWQTDPVTITPWQYLKQRKISNNKITISSPRPPCVPPVTMVYVQADTQTALILLHILSPTIPGGQRHFTPVKIIAENFIWNKESTETKTARNLRPSELSLRLGLMKAYPDSARDVLLLQIFS